MENVRGAISKDEGKKRHGGRMFSYKARAANKKEPRCQIVIFAKVNPGQQWFGCSTDDMGCKSS